MAVLNPNTNKPIITDVNNYKTVDKKKVDNVQQPQVAFINTIFEGFGGANSNSGSEAAFNA